MLCFAKDRLYLVEREYNLNDDVEDDEDGITYDPVQEGAEFLSCRCRATSCRSSRTKQIPRPRLHRFAGLTTSC